MLTRGLTQLPTACDQNCLSPQHSDKLKLSLKALEAEEVSRTANLVCQLAFSTANHHESYGQLPTKPLRGAEGSESCHAAKAGPQCQAAMHGTAEGEGCCRPLQGGTSPCKVQEHLTITASAQSLLAGNVPHRCWVLPGYHGYVNVQDACLIAMCSPCRQERLLRTRTCLAVWKTSWASASSLRTRCAAPVCPGSLESSFALKKQNHVQRKVSSSCSPSACIGQGGTSLLCYLRSENTRSAACPMEGFCIAGFASWAGSSFCQVAVKSQPAVSWNQHTSRC